MSQFEPTIDLPLAAPPARIRGRFRVPGWMMLLLRNRKSRIGLAMVGFVMIIAMIAPWISVLIRTGSTSTPRSRGRHGTTSSGRPTRAATSSRRSSSAPPLAAARALAAALATALAAVLGITGAYTGGLVDEWVKLLTNVFLVIPAIPLLIVVSGFLKSRGWDDGFVIAAVLWAFEARILRGQALSLKNRDFVLAAKAAGEPTRRIVFGELMPNMISRIAAAFVLVFYIALLVDAGLEFLGSAT